MKKLKTTNGSTFATYGLNVKKNFLTAPKCECGCGGYGKLVLETDQDLYSFMYIMLEEYDCNRCGIFAQKQNGAVIMALKLDSEIEIYSSCKTNTRERKRFIADTEKDLKLHCYGLLKQVDNNLYEIVMD